MHPESNRSIMMLFLTNTSLFKIYIFTPFISHFFLFRVKYIFMWNDWYQNYTARREDCFYRKESSGRKDIMNRYCDQKLYDWMNEWYSSYSNYFQRRGKIELNRFFIDWTESFWFVLIRRFIISENTPFLLDFFFLPLKLTFNLFPLVKHKIVIRSISQLDSMFVHQ